jgi:hypothetical protein
MVAFNSRYDELQIPDGAKLQKLKKTAIPD